MKPNDQKKAVREARQWAKVMQDCDSNEADTRIRVEKILETVCGYDPMQHLSREEIVKGSDSRGVADFVVSDRPDHIAFVVEVKRCREGINKNHIHQASQYATNIGCDWILMTNGRQWKLLHRETSQSVDLVLEWDALRTPEPDLLRCFQDISLTSVRKGGLRRLWRERKSLTPKNVVAALVAPSVIRAIRSELGKITGRRPTPEDILAGIRKNLNGAAEGFLEGMEIKLPSLKKTPKKKESPPVPTTEAKPAGGKKKTVLGSVASKIGSVFS